MKVTAPTIDPRPRRFSPRDVRQSLASRRRSATVERSLLGALAVMATCLTIALVVHGSEPANSGWSVSPPPSAFDAKRPTSPQMRIAINQVLEHGQMPLLQAPAQQRPAGAPDEEPPVDENAYAAADGWRPAHLPTERRPTAPVIAPAAEIGPRFRSVVDDSPSADAPADAETATDAAATDEADEPTSAPARVESDNKNQGPTTSLNTPAASATQTATSERPSPAEEPPVVEKPAPAPLPPLSQNMKNLRAKVRRVLKSYYNRPLNSRDNDPWESMHGMLAYGVHSKIRQGSPQGNTITLVGWLCYNRPCKGMTLLYLTPENDLRAKQGVGLQGHMGQFLAMLAQCQVSPDYPIRVRNQEFTIQDLIEAEKKTCYPKSELTFKLIALMHYLDSDATWVNDQGASWNIPRLIREELAQPIRSAACGGTHRLAGLSLAARTRVRRGEPLDGEYLRAAQFVAKYENYAYQMQNSDGSLSTMWFRGRGAEDDTDRRVKTTGHILEWLCYSVDDKEVRSARTFRAVNYLSSLLATNYNHDWEVGPLSHAIHALRLYDERVFQPYDGQGDVAKKTPRKTASRPNNSSSRPMPNK